MEDRGRHTPGQGRPSKLLHCRFPRKIRCGMLRDQGGRVGFLMRQSCSLMPSSVFPQTLFSISVPCPLVPSPPNDHQKSRNSPSSCPHSQLL